jgi:hypothetical protein
MSLCHRAALATIRKVGPGLLEQRNAADARDEVERQQREAERIRLERQEAEQRRLKAIEQSRAELFAVVEAWSLARNIERFFEDLNARIPAVPSSGQQAIIDRVQEARALLGGTDALKRFSEWRTPAERLTKPHATHEDDDDR